MVFDKCYKLMIIIFYNFYYISGVRETEKNNPEENIDLSDPTNGLLNTL
jgi:hypothetical protein|tara:strand:- start:1405 stop:1551 length:147 start_codon:yes stop_codon:yes gene_type:complete